MECPGPVWFVLERSAAPHTVLQLSYSSIAVLIQSTIFPQLSHSSTTFPQHYCRSSTVQQLSHSSANSSSTVLQLSHSSIEAPQLSHRSTTVLIQFYSFPTALRTAQAQFYSFPTALPQFYFTPRNRELYTSKLLNLLSILVQFWNVLGAVWIVLESLNSLELSGAF